MKFFILFCYLIVFQNTNSQITFERTYGGSGSEEGSKVISTNDNGYLIVGGTRSFGIGESDVYIIKTDNNGDTIWTKTVGGNRYRMGLFLL